MLAAASTAACRELPVSSGTRPVTISFTLVAGDSVQVAFLTEALPPDSITPMRFRGAAPSRVQLCVLDDLGASYPLEAADTGGRFVAHLTVQSGRHYRLEGEVDGLPVSAETTVPARFEIARPVGDTISAGSDDPISILRTVPYDFVADGATGFEYRVLRADGSVELSGGLRTASGSLLFFRTPEVRTAVFLAYNSDAAEWLMRVTPRGNVAGAFGAFGAALTLTRIVLLP